MSQCENYLFTFVNKLCTPVFIAVLPVYSVANQTRAGPSGRYVTLQVFSRASSFGENHPAMVQVGML